jgi:hypothetical protein
MGFRNFANGECPIGESLIDERTATHINTSDKQIMRNNLYTRLEKLIKYLPGTCPMIIIIIHRFKLPVDIIANKCNIIRFRIVRQ